MVLSYKVLRFVWPKCAISIMDVKTVKSFTRKQLALKLYDNFCGEMERDEYTVLFLNHLKGQNMYSNCVTGH